MGLNGKLAGLWWTLRNKRHFVVSDFAIEEFYCTCFYWRTFCLCQHTVVEPPAVVNVIQ